MDYLTRSRQPIGYVADCVKIDAEKLSRFATNAGWLTVREEARLESFLRGRRGGLRWWQGPLVKIGVVGGGAVAAALLRGWILILFGHSTP